MRYCCIYRRKIDGAGNDRVAVLQKEDEVAEKYYYPCVAI